MLTNTATHFCVDDDFKELLMVERDPDGFSHAAQHQDGQVAAQQNVSCIL